MEPLILLIACVALADIGNGQIAFPTRLRPGATTGTSKSPSKDAPTPRSQIDASISPSTGAPADAPAGASIKTSTSAPTAASSTDSSASTTTTPKPRLTNWGRTRHPKFTGDPQHDWEFDPNLPRELNGYNMTGYPFFSRVPEKMKYDCKGKIDGFYANVDYSCQVYHHCLYGIRQDFLCGNYTAFDMRTFICQFINLVDCKNSDTYTYRNEPLYKVTTTKAPRKKRPFRRRFEDYYDYDDYYLDEDLDNYAERKRTSPRPLRKKERKTTSRLLARIKSKQAKKKPARKDYSYNDDYYYDDYYSDNYYDDYYYDEPATTTTTTTTTTTRRPLRRRRPGGGGGGRRPGGGGRRRRPAGRRRFTGGRFGSRPEPDYYSDYDTGRVAPVRQRNRFQTDLDYPNYGVRAASSPSAVVALAPGTAARPAAYQPYPDYDAEDILEYPVSSEVAKSRATSAPATKRRVQQPAAGQGTRLRRVRPQPTAAAPESESYDYGDYYPDSDAPVYTAAANTAPAPQARVPARAVKPAPPARGVKPAPPARAVKPAPSLARVVKPAPSPARVVKPAPPARVAKPAPPLIRSNTRTTNTRSGPPPPQSLESALDIQHTLLPPARDAENEVLEPVRRQVGSSRGDLMRRRPVRLRARSTPAPPQPFFSDYDGGDDGAGAVARSAPVVRRIGRPNRGRRRFQPT